MNWRAIGFLGVFAVYTVLLFNLGLKIGEVPLLAVWIGGGLLIWWLGFEPTRHRGPELSTLIRNLPDGTQLRRSESRRRSVWGRLAIFAFVAFNLAMAFDALYITRQVDTLRRTTTGLGHIGLNIAANQKMNEHITVWVAGAVILGLLVWATRGRLEATETIIDGLPEEGRSARPSAARQPRGPP